MKETLIPESVKTVLAEFVSGLFTNQQCTKLECRMPNSRANFLAAAGSTFVLAGCGGANSTSFAPHEDAAATQRLSIVWNEDFTEVRMVETATNMTLIACDPRTHTLSYDPGISRMSNARKALLPPIKPGYHTLYSQPCTQVATTSAGLLAQGCGDSGGGDGGGDGLSGGTGGLPGGKGDGGGITKVGDVVNGLKVIAVVSTSQKTYSGTVTGSGGTIYGLSGSSQSYQYITKPTGCRKDINVAAAGVATLALSILLPAGFALADTASVAAILAAVGPAGWIILGIGLFMALLACADAYNECQGQ